MLGMVIDRDIAVRGVAAGLLPAAAKVADVMNRNLEFCTEDQLARPGFEEAELDQATKGACRR